MSFDVHDFFTRYIRAISDRDYDVLEKLLHPEFMIDYPQSGERFRGFASFRRQLEAYPGGLPAASAEDPTTKIIGEDERWVISPNYTVLPMTAPERFTTVSRVPYPDGTRWWVVSITTLKDQKVFYAETYFAPEFDPPEWRRDMVEILPRD